MLRNKQPAEDPVRARARKRLATLPRSEVLDWADQAGTGLAKALDDYRRQGDEISLREAAEGVAALAGAVDALLTRH